MLSHDEVTEQSNELLDLTVIKVVEVTSINFDPHPYMVGSAHVVHASDHWGGMLSSDSIRDLERKRGHGMCEWKEHGQRCTKTHDQHKSDTVAIMQLQRDAENDEVKNELLKLTSLFEANGVDGFVFLETEEGYRVH